MNPFKGRRNIREFFESIPPGVIELQTRLQTEKSEKEYQEFLSDLEIGKCFLCGNPMNSVDELSPCFHWFTFPAGIKKKYFESYLAKPVGFFNLDCYFRWLANSETPITNINDLKDETSKTSYLETTIRYKNIEWAFSVGHTDKEGHAYSRVGDIPHYHIQMKVDDRIFLKFNDFHIPFSDSDLFTMEMQEQANDIVAYEPYLGHGISILENEDNLKIIEKEMEITEDEAAAPFRIQTVIQAKEGKPLSGALIQQAFEESKRTKEPVGFILKRLLSGDQVTVIISPGDGVPDMTKRSGKK